MKIKLLPAFLALGFLLTGCVSSLYKNGVKEYDRMAYTNAIEDLEKYLLKRDDPDAMIKLAHSYRLVNDVPNAEKWYSKVVGLKESDPINMFYYGRMLMGMEKYEEAKVWFKKYIDIVPDDFVAEMLLASCNSVREFKKDTSLFSLKEVEMPEVANSFGATAFRGGIIFAADKVSFRRSDTYEWTGHSYIDLYFSKKDENGKWLSPMELKGNINGEFHEGPACFNKESDIVYFTRSNADGKKLKKSTKSENNLKLYRAELVGDKWTNVTELPFNNDEYSCGHPSLSEDGKSLYFISDMPGGYGGTDIYKVNFEGDNWEKPENLGAAVNTSGNEMFPYMHYDGTLYFSSDAHTNMGGLDVFMTFFDGKKWLQVENLNYPLNSPADDFAFILNEDDVTGYVSSNRNNEDKIYEVTKHAPTFVLSGVVNQKGKPGEAIDSAIVEIHNLTTNREEKVLTDKNGLYKVKLNAQCEYLVRTKKPMYFPSTPPQAFNMKGKKISENFVANFELDKIEMEKPIVLENIYYDLDKWDIRSDAAKELDRIVKVMRDNPKLTIELSSHTDSRAADQYNLVLSDKRAKAAVEYIISKGVDAKRMKWRGYGETHLVSPCFNDGDCPEEVHQKNRRTEFKAINLNQPLSSK